jgi:hypothetical protein
MPSESAVNRNPAPTGFSTHDAIETGRAFAQIGVPRVGVLLEDAGSDANIVLG